MNYEEALNYIHAVQWAGHKPGLTRTRTLLAALGDPHKQLRFIHVAGTNGKGSTAAMLASCLQAAGYRVGLYTSPFINRFNERIQINGQQIPDEALVALVEQVKPAADAMEDVPTEFEIITALGMLYFAQQQCDIVVLEVGLGGTLDSTNVIETPACAVITALGMDHVKELGPTLADIAAAKAGIIKPNCTAIIGPQPHEEAVMPILAEAAERNHAMLVRDGYEMTASDRMAAVGGQVATLTTPNGTYEGVPIAKFGEHQAHNALAALAASEVVIPVNGPLDGDLVAEALSSVKIPGRIEQIRTSPTIILDGGHNVNAAEALRKAIEESYDFKQLVGVVAMMRDKQVEEYLGVLEPILSSVVVTENSWRERVMPADELEKIAVDVFGRDRVIKEANLPDAIQTAVNMVDAEDELGVGYGHGVLICGSFVTAGDARLMLEEHASPTMRQAMAVHQPAVDPDDSDQPADKAEDEAADNLEDSVSPDDFDVFDVLGLGKEQAGDAGTGTASADTDSTDTASADTDDSADAR